METMAPNIRNMRRGVLLRRDANDHEQGEVGIGQPGMEQRIVLGKGEDQ